jgi:hypothetical protein
MRDSIDAALGLKGLMVVIGLGGLALGAVLIRSTWKKDTAGTMVAATEEGVGIPPIDMNAPAETETATFALG